MPLTMMKVCTSRAWGGMEMSMVRSSVGLRSRGHRVIPVCAPGTPTAIRLCDLGFTPVLADLRIKVHPLQAWRLGSLIQKEGVEVVHCDWSRDLFTLVPALLGARRTPLVLHKHVGVIRPKRLWIHHWLYRRVDMVVAISEVIRANVIAMHPIDPAKVTVIHHGIDLSRFTPDPQRRARTRASLNLAPDHLVVGIVGRIAKAKGHIEFFDMARSVAASEPRARFLVVGEPTHGEEAAGQAILDLIGRYGIADRVIVTGFRQDIPEMLEAMDIFAFPSRAEAFGLALIEAMAMGLPTVSSNCDGVLDIVVAGETGLMVPPRDGAPLAAAVGQLLASADLRARLGQAGRARAHALFGEDRMLRRLEELYADLIHRRASG
jgi:glycosyltransferase involved in cell wall biosynthesis